MSQFLEACTQSPVNLALSVLLVLILIYWIIVFVGAVGMDSLDLDLDIDGEPDFDIDLDVDADVDVDVDVDVDADVDVDTDGNLFHAGIGTSILKFFHIGTVPVLVLLSVFVLTLWAIGVLSYRWIGSWGVVLQLLMVIPFAIVAIFLTKIVTTPLNVLFKKMQEQEDAEQKVDLIGQRCIVVSLTADHRHGQVEVQTEGAPLRLNVVTGDTGAELKKGDEAVLVAKSSTPGVYTIRGFDL